MIDSGSEGEANDSNEDLIMPTPESISGATAQATVKKGRKPLNGGVSKVTKPKSSSTRAAELSATDSTKAGATKKAKSTKASTRAPLKEKKNEQTTSETEEVDDFEDEHGTGKSKLSAATTDELGASLVAVKQPVKRGKKVQAKKTRSAGDQAKVGVEETETVETGSKENKTKNTGKTKGNNRKPPVELENEKVIAETQVTPMDLDDSVMQDADEDIDELTPQPADKRTGCIRSESTLRRPTMSGNRAGSASETERGGSDPAIRRKLGDMAKRFESLDLKYRNLRETGIKEAEANYEKLKRQTDQKAKGMRVVSSLHRALLTTGSCE